MSLRSKFSPIQKLQLTGNVQWEEWKSDGFRTWDLFVCFKSVVLRKTPTAWNTQWIKLDDFSHSSHCPTRSTRKLYVYCDTVFITNSNAHTNRWYVHRFLLRNNPANLYQSARSRTRLDLSWRCRSRPQK